MLSPGISALLISNSAVIELVLIALLDSIN